MATYYISPSGNDTTGSGTSGSPWLTLSKAVTSAASGDTIICKNGTYTMVSTTIDKAVFVQAETTGSVIWDGAASSVQWSFKNFASTTNRQITGLTFQNIALTASTGVMNFAPSVANNANATIEFVNCLFKTITLPASTGVVFNSDTSTCTIKCTGCVINDPCAASSTALGIIANYASGDPVGVFVNCVIDLRTATGRVGQLLSGGGSARLTLKNCIVRNATGATVTCDNSSGSKSTVTYSDLYLITSAPAGTGNITSDPLFVDAANGNFRLRPTSPCLNAGVNS